MLKAAVTIYVNNSKDWFKFNISTLELDANAKSSSLLDSTVDSKNRHSRQQSLQALKIVHKFQQTVRLAKGNHLELLYYIQGVSAIGNNVNMYEDIKKKSNLQSNDEVYTHRNFITE